MMHLTESDYADNATYGGKAQNLMRLEKLGLPVPNFVVIPADILHELLPMEVQSTHGEALVNGIAALNFPKKFISQVRAGLPSARYFAVRSSALGEDGTDFSFAGLFESYLFVKPEDLAEKIRAVWLSAYAPRVAKYRQHHGLPAQGGMAIIVQEMINADVSGVAFGANPVNGKTDEKIIDAVYGLGEGLVSGALDADHYVVKNGQITVQLAHKTQQTTFNKQNKGGVVLTPVPPKLQDNPTLNDTQILELVKILDRLQAELGQPQDVEFAYQDDKLFLLQTRPVTTLGQTNVGKKGAYVLWDNSNIIESYPGVTTPLTFSFISSSYEGAYRQFSAYLGVSERVISENRRVFANTLGLLDGRVYYNLKTWYHMLAMLPGYSLNARYMEKMMGVKERFDLPEKYRLSKAKAWGSIVAMACQMLGRFLALPRKRREFMALVERTIARYKAIDYAEKDAHELMDLYLDFEKTLLDKWKAPLLNDFFAMIWFGMLQKQVEKHLGDRHPNLHNDLLCGSSDIISVEPVRRSIGLASQIVADRALHELFTTKNEKEIWQELRRNPAHAAFLRDVEKYLADFGERCVGELKLETVSYAQDPVRFVRVLKSYAESGVTDALFSSQRESEIRQTAEREVAQALRGRPLAKWWLNGMLKTTRTLVSARENLRYERTRAFGVVRQLFSQLGQRFYREGILPDKRAIFYLTKEEIFAYLEGRSVTGDIAALVALRRREFAAYQAVDAPPERFATHGAPYHANDFKPRPGSAEEKETPVGTLQGIGCSPGRVSGRVRVVRDPAEVASLDGDILVASSTDPGWVMLFPAAGGIVVERGSLLSHSAIVSREMGKPCIVGVTGLLDTLKTGDAIEMDGSTGIIKILTP